MMKLSDVRRENRKGVCRLSAKVDCNLSDVPERLWFEVPIEFQKKVNKSLNPFVISLLILAMRYREDVCIEGPVDKNLLINLRKYIEKLSNLIGKYKKIEILHKGRTVNDSSDNKTALSFTGGIDSFFYLKTHFKEVDYCLYVLGLDIKLNHKKALEEKKRVLGELGAKLSKKMLFVKTNVRNFTDVHLNYVHTVFLLIAGAASVYNPLFSKYIVSTGFPEKQREKNIYGGSHPSLLKFISSKGLKFKEKTPLENRVHKTIELSNWSPAQDYLQVCTWQDDDNTQNCGMCTKCIRTMATLEINGKLDKFKTFDKRFSKLKLLKTPFINGSGRKFLRDVYSFAKEKKRFDIANTIKLSLILGFPLFIINKTFFKNRYGRKILGSNIVKKIYFKIIS